MPMHYKIDSERGMLFIAAEGETSQAERFEAMQTWMNDPEFRPGLQTLADFSKSADVPTLAELEEIVGYMRRYQSAIGQKKIAIVTTRPVSFGVARQFGALAPGEFLTVRVFKDRDAALAWLADGSGATSPSK
jgi:sulfate adenylyltransferase subunit 1 (EFTu-like GTPase family)